METKQKVVACVRQADVVIKDNTKVVSTSVRVTSATLSERDRLELRRLEQDRILFWI